MSEIISDFVDRYSDEVGGVVNWFLHSNQQPLRFFTISWIFRAWEAFLAMVVKYNIARSTRYKRF